jgi:hypothetical protein
MDSSTSLKPNDIALILRPTLVDGVYQKHFQVLVSGFGPLTISEDDINNLIGMATILAATVQYMEEDEELANKLVEYCGKMFADVGDFFYNADHDSFGEGGFTINTKTIGGVQ